MRVRSLAPAGLVAPDTATTSKCNGSCATVWPPVAGQRSPAPSLTVTYRAGDRARACHRARPAGPLALPPASAGVME
jgi:hypothetical protein